jgi:hypothetical protein
MPHPGRVVPLTPPQAPPCQSPCVSPRVRPGLRPDREPPGREAWEGRARAGMDRLKSEDLSSEADAWEYADGNVRIVGTNLAVSSAAAQEYGSVCD